MASGSLRTGRGGSARSALLLAAVLLSGASAGCSRMRGVSRCRALAQKVNHALDAVEAATSEPKPGAKGYRTASTHYAALAKELEGFDAERPELEQSLAELADVARGAKEQTALLSDALANGNRVTKVTAERELERLARRQKTVTQRIEKTCSGH